MSLTFRRAEQNGKGAFTAWDGDTKAGTMTYSRLNDHVVIIDHTEAAPGFEGRGVGKRLVSHGVDWARENDQKLMPLCPFAKSVFDRTAEWQDVRFG
jgi:predicted GNAT family acetyltransferase